MKYFQAFKVESITLQKKKKKKCYPEEIYPDYR